MQELERLREIVMQLRDPVSGCPWDIEQTFETIAPHTIEEAYEVADAIERGDMDGLKLELGDLLLQVVGAPDSQERLFTRQLGAIRIREIVVRRVLDRCRY